jgi:hypothetical protein
MYRPMREKVILVMLVVGGIAMTIAGIARLVSLLRLLKNTDYTYSWQTTAIWT